MLQGGLAPSNCGKHKTSHMFPLPPSILPCHPNNPAGLCMLIFFLAFVIRLKATSPCSAQAGCLPYLALLPDKLLHHLVPQVPTSPSNPFQKVKKHNSALSLTEKYAPLLTRNHMVSYLDTPPPRPPTAAASASLAGSPGTTDRAAAGSRTLASPLPRAARKTPLPPRECLPFTRSPEPRGWCSHSCPQCWGRSPKSKAKSKFYGTERQGASHGPSCPTAGGTEPIAHAKRHSDSRQTLQ